MLSPILLCAAGGFGVLAVHGWPTDHVLAGVFGVHAAIALLVGTGVADWGAGSRGVLGLVTVQVLLIGPTLYAVWRAEWDVVPG